MEYYSEKISMLISELGSLPGIGTKSAQRLAFHILDMPKEKVERLTETIRDAKTNVKSNASDISPIIIEADASFELVPAGLSGVP